MFICCCGVCKNGSQLFGAREAKVVFLSFCLSFFFFLEMSYLPLSLKLNVSVQREGGGKKRYGNVERKMLIS